MDYNFEKMILCLALSQKDLTSSPEIALQSHWELVHRRRRQASIDVFVTVTTGARKCSGKKVLGPSLPLSFLLKKLIKMHCSSVIDEGESTLTASKSLIKFRNTLFKSSTTDHSIPPNSHTMLKVCGSQCGAEPNSQLLPSRDLTAVSPFIDSQLMPCNK